MKYSGKVYVYRYFSKKGFGNIYYFTENLNANLLYTIYETTLLPSAGIFFGKNNHSWKLQEDNNPKHISGKAKKWKKDNDIKRISWPSQSLDLNLIENIWAVLKANISNYKLSSTKELIRIIKKEWKKLDKVFAKN